LIFGVLSADPAWDGGLRAYHLAQGSDLGNNGVETKVAGLFTVRDATYGEKNMSCNGSYSKKMTHHDSILSITP
jgi:hypothetical protein